MKKNNRMGIIPFLTAGIPSLSSTRRIILSLESEGADIIEIGVPFSDPMADGPIIQRASERSLRNGTTLRKVLGLVRAVRKESDVPILLMGYYNPIHSYGLEKFARDAARAGVDAALVVDLPPEESAPLDRELKRNGIDLIYLLAPTSDRKRIRLVARKGRGFLYFVSMTGVTGGQLTGLGPIRKKIAEIRRFTPLPIAIGFGIRTASDASRLSRIADGVVVGSRLVELISSSSTPSKTAGRFMRSLRRAV